MHTYLQIPNLCDQLYQVRLQNNQVIHSWYAMQTGFYQNTLTGAILCFVIISIFHTLHFLRYPYYIQKKPYFLLFYLLSWVRVIKDALRALKMIIRRSSLVYNRLTNATHPKIITPYIEWGLSTKLFQRKLSYFSTRCFNKYPAYYNVKLRDIRLKIAYKSSDIKLANERITKYLPDWLLSKPLWNFG